MTEGLFKRKFDFYKAEFTTGEGIWDFLIGSFIWGFLILTFSSQVYGFIQTNILTFLGEGTLKSYVGYLIFGLFSWAVGLGITFILTKVYRFVFKR